MKSCRSVRAGLFDSFEHALEIEETLAIEDHLRSCAACAEAARRARAVHESFARLSDAPLARLDVERSVGVVRAAIDRRTVAPSSRPRHWRWIAAAAVFVALVIAARFVFTGDTTTNTPAPRVVEHVRAPDPPPVIAEASGGAHASTPAAPVELAPLEPIDTARLEESRASVREAIVTMLPVLEAHDVAGFVAGIDRATSDLTRNGWPVERIVERLADDADTRVANGALRWLGRRGDALTVRRLEGALLDTDHREPAAAALVDALRERDSSALAAVLARGVKARPRALDARFALDLVVRERIGAALPWVEDLARERAQKGDVAIAQASVETIAAFDDVNALRALLRLREANRFPNELVEPALAAHLERSPRWALELAGDEASPRRADELRALNEALLEAPCSAFVPTWIELAAAKELSRGDRRFAILLAGEHGSVECIEALTDLLRRFDRKERDLKAAVLIAIHDIGGEGALEKVLAGTPKEARAKILELFRRADPARKPESNLLELARRLEPLIAPLQL
jgi:hypothetical protein